MKFQDWSPYSVTIWWAHATVRCHHYCKKSW